MLPFVFCFQKDRKRNKVRFSFFISMKELKSELIKNININFMVIFTSKLYTLFKSKFVLSPLKFSAVQWSREHQESSVYKTAHAF